MFHRAARREVKRLGARRDRRGKTSSFLFHGAEKCGELIEVVLAPFLVRMMMAACAFQPCAEEQLTEHRREVSRLAPIAVDDRRAVAMVRALGKQDFANELIVGFVLPEALAQ